MTSTNFKVIIVGGGPVGFTAAHALSRANIDFVLLERRPEVVIETGSNLVMLPTGLRLLGQLGILDDLISISSPLGQVERFDHSGRSLGDSRFFVHLRENHGQSPRVVSRHQLTKVLYDTLPSKHHASMLPNKKVSGIATTSDGVVVSCADGTSYEGSIVIGADGAHSLIREQMRTLAMQASPAVPESDINDEQPFLTTYRALWVRFPTQSDLQPGNANETHGHGAAIQLFAGEETSVIGLYERLGEPTRERTRYNQADRDAFVDRWGHLPISRNLTLRDAYTSKEESGLVSLEEGVVKNWSWDRIVLVGDAAHKFTPSTGAGCNNGIVDIVALVNELHKMVEHANTLKTAPSKAQITSAFKEYQNTRFESVKAGCAGASQATASATWQTAMFRFVDRHIMASHRFQKFVAGHFASSIARTPILDFIEGDEQFIGKVAWAQPMQPCSVKAN